MIRPVSLENETTLFKGANGACVVGSRVDGHAAPTKYLASVADHRADSICTKPASLELWREHKIQPSLAVAVGPALDVTDWLIAALDEKAPYAFFPAIGETFQPHPDVVPLDGGAR